MKRNWIILIIVVILSIGMTFLLKSRRQTHSLVVTETHEDLRSDETLPLPVDIVPASEEDEASSVESELSAVMSELPTLDILKDLSEEEVHHTPVIILEGGKLIGQMLEKANLNPERREATLSFFKSCAENEEVAPQIRALCWKRTLTQISEWEIFLPISGAKVPDEIKNLGNKIP